MISTLLSTATSSYSPISLFPSSSNLPPPHTRLRHSPHKLIDQKVMNRYHQQGYGAVYGEGQGRVASRILVYERVY
ncbi:MAG: hypothetical protein FVQ77_09625 [Cytophagales bacterium]|nr:hypothetical protein [Cytophagales bacterium]